MKFSFHLAGAVALGAALVLTGCSKSSDTSSTSSATATTAPADATAAPAGATTAPASGGEASVTTPDPAASTSSVTVGNTTVSSSNGGGGKAGFITIPVYPGATQNAGEGMDMSANGTSVKMQIFTSKDDAKAVADWYKTHLPGAWKNGILTTDGKTVGTFSNEMTDGDQSVIISSTDDKTTRIQLTTKHGK